MFLKKKLKKMGIDVIGKVDDMTIIQIANQVAQYLTEAFPEITISYLEIYKKILDTPMFYAHISKGMSEANFYYKNSSIYFSDKTDLNSLNEYTLHECIHRLQEKRGKRGKLIGMGLSQINDLNVRGTALNEAGIQYIVSNVLKKPEKDIMICDIEFKSQTQYYPIITNLINQVASLIGDKFLIDSTINSNENFKIEIIDNFGETEYIHIEKNSDEILNMCNRIIGLKQQNVNIDSNIQAIQEKYFETQAIIYTGFFEKRLKRVETIDEINELREVLKNYKDIIGYNENYRDFDLFCEGFEIKVEKKVKKIIASTSLVVISDNILYKVFRNLKKLFTNSSKEYNK